MRMHLQHAESHARRPLEDGAALVVRRLDLRHGRQDLWRRVLVDAVQEDPDDDDPALAALAAVVRVRLLRVAPLVPAEHAHGHRFRRQDARACSKQRSVVRTTQRCRLNPQRRQPLCVTSRYVALRWVTHLWPAARRARASSSRAASRSFRWRRRRRSTAAPGGTSCKRRHVT